MISLNTHIWVVKHPVLALAIFITAVDLLQLQSYRYEQKVPKEPDIVYGGQKIPAEKWHERNFANLIIFSVMIKLIFTNLIYQEVWEGVLLFSLLDLFLALYKLFCTDIKVILAWVEIMLLAYLIWFGLGFSYLLKTRNDEDKNMPPIGNTFVA